MPKEYRTIEEVAGPLMLVRGVQDVTYNELGEIELANGEKRRCKVLEIDGGNALVQLFEASTGINLSSSKVRFLGRSMELGVSEDMLSRMFDGLGRPIDGGPGDSSGTAPGYQRLPMKPRSQKLSPGIYSDRDFRIDGLNTLVRGQKLPYFLRFRSAPRQSGGSDRAAGESTGNYGTFCRRLRCHGNHF